MFFLELFGIFGIFGIFWIFWICEIFWIFGIFEIFEFFEFLGFFGIFWNFLEFKRDIQTDKQTDGKTPGRILYIKLPSVWSANWSAKWFPPKSSRFSFFISPFERTQNFKTLYRSVCQNSLSRGPWEGFLVFQRAPVASCLGSTDRVRWPEAVLSGGGRGVGGLEKSKNPKKIKNFKNARKCWKCMLTDEKRCSGAISCHFEARGAPGVSCLGSGASVGMAVL